MSDLEAVKKALPHTPVLANTGVKHATIGDVLKIADGCIVGSSLKVDGNTWNAVDPDRAAEFMRLARAARAANDDGDGESGGKTEAAEIAALRPHDDFLALSGHEGRVRRHIAGATAEPGPRERGPTRWGI